MPFLSLGIRGLRTWSSGQMAEPSRYWVGKTSRGALISALLLVVLPGSHRHTNFQILNKHTVFAYEYIIYLHVDRHATSIYTHTCVYMKEFFRRTHTHNANARFVVDEISHVSAGQLCCWRPCFASGIKHNKHG